MVHFYTLNRSNKHIEVLKWSAFGTGDLVCGVAGDMNEIRFTIPETVSYIS